MTSNDTTKAGDRVRFHAGDAGKLTGQVTGTKLSEGQPMLMITAAGRSYERRVSQVIRVSRT